MFNYKQLYEHLALLYSDLQKNSKIELSYKTSQG